MDKNRLMKKFGQPDTKLLFSKVLDRALLCEKKGFKTFSDFLDPLSARNFAQTIEEEKSCNVITYGGAFGCERLMIGFFNEYDTLLESDFPIHALEIVHNNVKLTHRDFLGSLLGTGVSRDKLGDIFIFADRSIAFLESGISDYVLGTLTSVGSTPISCSILEDDFLIAPFADSQSKNIVVSSMRLDAVVAAIFNLSRGKAAKFIDSEKVFVNWQSVKSQSRPVAEGDNITLRGTGRSKIETINGTTSKDNISITVKLL